MSLLSNLVDQSFHNASNTLTGNSGDPPGFTNLAPIQSASGSQVRQASIPNYRLATATRNMVRWFLPELGVVEMYVNPQSIRYTDTKNTSSPVRTRGGYMVQYWGEELGKVSISGTTGSSGVEGINVIYDIYRNEQVALDPLALAAEAARDNEAMQRAAAGALNNGSFIGSVGNIVGGIVNAGVSSLFDQVNSVIKTGNVDPVLPRPTLASIAFQTEMYWSGWVFRGYFNSMTVNESADKLGLFDYSLEFTVTQKRGLRLNFLPHHRSAVNGPSNSDPYFGVPYSFSALKNKVPQRSVSLAQQNTFTTTIRSLDRALQSSRPL